MSQPSPEGVPVEVLEEVVIVAEDTVVDLDVIAVLGGFEEEREESGAPCQLRDIIVAMSIWALIMLVVVGLVWYGARSPTPSDEVPIEWNTSVFDLTMAMSALLSSKVAYCDQEAVLNWTCEVCQLHLFDFTLHQLYKNDSRHSFGLSGVWPSQQLIVVAFRGTTNFDNWIEDLKFFFAPYPNPECVGCSVHKGFYQVFESVQLRVQADLQYLLVKYPRYKVLFTGHSLGGAVALLSALDLVAPRDSNSTILPFLRAENDTVNPILPVHPDRLLLYTFGAPRVGERNFTTWAAQKLPFSYRLTHQRDVVPHLPPASLGYVHLSSEKWFQNDLEPLEFVTCNDTATAEDQNCSASVWRTTAVDHHWYLGLRTWCSENNSASVD